MVSRVTAMCGMGATLAAVLFTVATSAHAMSLEKRSWREGVFGSAPPTDERQAGSPMVAHFEVDAGSSFVLDRRFGDTVLMRFDGSPEIWALRPSAGPRGDVIYKNDLGEAMLRSTRLGGLTLFTPDRPQGSAVAMAGQAPGLHPITVSGMGALLQVFAQASARAGRAAQHLISFEAVDIEAGTESLLADAAILTAEAFQQVAGDNGEGRSKVARFNKVQFDQAKKVEVRIKGAVVQINVAPSEGLNGRPSSRRIAQELAKK